MPSPPTGTLEAIWLKPAHGAPMEPRNAVQLRADAGIVGNADQGGKRQVTLIHRERWDEVATVVGGPVDPSVRRANLLVRSLALAEAIGKVLVVGSCRIRIRGETTPCDLLDRAAPGLSEALRSDWGGGAFGEVLTDAEIAVGDPVGWEEDEARS